MGKARLALIAVVVGIALGAGLAVGACRQTPTIGEVNDGLGSGVNLGQALEAPREGDWGFALEAEYFLLASQAGFDHVRVPVNWAAYADTSSPYTIPDGDDPTVVHPDYSNIWERVDWVLDQAEDHDLKVILNVHHYEELHDDPVAHGSRFEAIWEQIASRYADVGDHLLFELLNEPTGDFTEDPQLWNDLFASTLATVRTTNPDRPVLVGPVGFNAIEFLDDLTLPDDDHLIATVHFYEPFSFTHQGAGWVDPTPPVGTAWDSSALSMGPAWNDFSWSAVRTPASGELVVDFEEQWAGLNFNSSDPFAPASLTFTSSGAADVQVVCDIGEGDVVAVEVLSLSAAGTESEVDLGECPDSTTGIFFQLASPGPAEVRFSDGEVCTASECTPLFANAVDRVQARIAEAQEWGQANNRPMNVGEFGAFAADGASPIDSRAAWTATVREAAAGAAMSTTYWEFGGGFGVYDPNSDTWVTELREALLD